MQSKFSNVMCCLVDVFSSQAYLNYSMHVILDRASPHIVDGLPSRKYKKYARTVGDFLGKYHLYSDISWYEAMVLMTQNINRRK